LAVPAFSWSMVDTKEEPPENAPAAQQTLPPLQYEAQKGASPAALPRLPLSDEPLMSPRVDGESSSSTSRPTPKVSLSDVIKGKHQPTDMPEATKPLERVFALRYCNVNMIQNIDDRNERFEAIVYMELWCQGGAKDPDLSAKGSNFPMGADGKPTFRPPIGWYASKLDFNNAIRYELMSDPVIKKDGDDVGAAVRYKGEFFVAMDLEMYPFDMQKLTFSLCVNCRTMGPTPVKLLVAKGSELTVQPEGFLPRQGWQVRPRLSIVRTCVGSSPDRMFPTMELSAIVTRRPGYAIWNVLIPMALMAPLASFALVVPIDAPGERLAISLATLLTAAAYKTAVASTLPAISYLTYLDQYTLSSLFLIIIVSCIMVVSTQVLDRVSLEWAKDVEWVLTTITGLVYVAINLYFYKRLSRFRKRVEADLEAAAVATEAASNERIKTSELDTAVMGGAVMAPLTRSQTAMKLAIHLASRLSESSQQAAQQPRGRTGRAISPGTD